MHEDRQEQFETAFADTLFDEPEENPVVSQLRRAPWIMASTVLHVSVLMMAVLLWQADVPAAELSVINAKLPPPVENIMEMPPPDIVKTDKLVKDEVKVEEPIISDQHDDVTETDNNEEFEMAKGDPNLTSSSTLTNNNQLPAIGIGPGSGGNYGGRFGGKQDRIASGGGSPATENAVIDALRWLMRHQSENGAWDGDGFHEHCDKGYGAPCGANGCQEDGDPGLTGLALLAYLGAGYTHDDGSEFAPTVMAGLRYLRDVQNDEGFFIVGPLSHPGAYSHVIATLAMTEAFGLTDSEIFRGYAQRGIDVIVEWQNEHPERDNELFGWRYFPRDGDNDTSVTGWMVMAVKSAKANGLDVPESTLQGARNWLEFVTDQVYYQAGYQMPGGTGSIPSSLRDKARPTPSTTAIAVLCRAFLGESAKTAAIRMGASVLLNDPPKWENGEGANDYYYWYYGTLAMYQVGGEPWKKWNENMKTCLVDHQLKRDDGCKWGSWDDRVSKWGHGAGRVYTTALNCLTLEVYYRYDRVIK